MSSVPTPRLRSVIGTTFVWKLGDGLIATGLGYIALVATGSSFWVGVQYAVSLATAALGAAFLGRWMDHQHLIVIVRAGVALALLGVATMAVSPGATDATILFLLAATGLISVSFVLMSVALSAAVAAAVPPDRLLLGTTQARSAQLAARALGGLVLSVLLYATRTPVILVLVAALTLILWLACERVLGASRQVIPPSDDNESALKVFVRAVRDCRPQRLVLAMLLCYGIFVSPFVALLPVLAQTLTGNSKNVGWLSAVYFAGGTVSILSGYVSTRINIPLAARTFLACGLSGLWLLAIVVSLSTTSGTLLVVLGGAFTFLFGHASTMLLSVFNVAAQEFSPGYQRRRILSALILLGATVGTAAVLLAGWWSEVQSLAAVLLTCAIALIAFALIQLRWRRASNIAPDPALLH